MSQVGNDVHCALAVNCSEKHLSSVCKSLYKSMIPLKTKEKELGLTKHSSFKIVELR